MRDRIEVMIAVREVDFDSIEETLSFKRKKMKRRTKGDNKKLALSKKQRQKLSNNVTGHFKRFKLTTRGRPFETYIFLVDAAEDGGLIKEITDLQSSMKRSIVIGAWNKDGSHYGQTLITDEKGNDTIKGKAVYPLHPKFMLMFNDVVTYSTDNIEISRTTATVPSETIKIAGRADRRWN